MEALIRMGLLLVVALIAIQTWLRSHRSVVLTGLSVVSYSVLLLASLKLVLTYLVLS